MSRASRKLLEALYATYALSLQPVGIASGVRLDTQVKHNVRDSTVLFNQSIDEPCFDISEADDQLVSYVGQRIQEAYAYEE